MKRTMTGPPACSGDGAADPVAQILQVRIRQWTPWRAAGSGPHGPPVHVHWPEVRIQEQLVPSALNIKLTTGIGLSDPDIVTAADDSVHAAGTCLCLKKRGHSR